MNTIKIVVIGDKIADKTGLLFSYASNRKYSQEYNPIVFDNYTATVFIDGAPYTLGLFDTTGQEEHTQLRPLTYAHTDIYLVCFSVVSHESFKNVKTIWVPEIHRYSKETPFILVGTQTELRSDASTLENLSVNNETPVSYKDGVKLAKKLNAAKYIECSSAKRIGVERVFKEAIKAALEPLEQNKPECNLM